MDNKRIQVLSKEATEVYNKVQQEVNTFQTETNNLLEGFATRAKNTYNRFKKLEKENESYNALLLGAELRGLPSSPDIIRKASETEVEYKRLKAAMGSLSALAGLAVLHMEKKISEVGIRYNEANNELEGFKRHISWYSEAIGQKPDQKTKNEITRRSEAVGKLKAELDDKRETLRVLKELTTNKSAAADGETLVSAQAVITSAAMAYNTRVKISEQILDEIELIKKEEEEIKKRKAEAFDVLSASSPDVIHYLLTPIIPIIDVEMFNNTDNDTGNVADLLVRRRARELSDK